MAKKNIKNITQMSKFEATMFACQKAKAKTLRENASKSNKTSVTKKTIKSTNRKVENALRRRIVEDEEYDPEIDDTDLPADTATDAVIVIDPELSTDEYEANLDGLQTIIDETPEGEVPSTEEYVDDFVYTCPICGNNFFSDTELGSDEECPVCGETVDEFILVGGIESPDEALNDEDEEDLDTDTTDIVDDADDISDEELEVDIDEEPSVESLKNRRLSAKKESYKYLIDEKTLNPFLTKFIKENYKNASSMKVVGATLTGRRIKMECVIKFKSGSTKKTLITLENFKPTTKISSIVGKVDNTFKVESKKSAPFIFEAYTKGNVIRFTGMKYSFLTKKEGKRIQIYGKYALKESLNKRPRRLKESKFREFSKTDWYSYQGASDFEDGSSPLIANFFNEDITLIISGGDNNSGKPFVELDFYNEELDKALSFGKSFKSKEKALIVAKNIASKLESWDYAEEEDVRDLASACGLSELNY